jgi:hypothetical protein
LEFIELLVTGFARANLGLDSAIDALHALSLGISMLMRGLLGCPTAYVVQILAETGRGKEGEGIRFIKAIIRLLI